MIDSLIPVISLTTGVQPVAGTTTSFAFFFLPFMFLNMYTLYLASEGSVTLRALSFSMSSWSLQLSAIKSVLLKQKMGFAITPKKAVEGNFLFLALPHISYAGLVIVAGYAGVLREGFSPSVITNITWGFFNLMMFVPFIKAAYNWSGLWEKITSPLMNLSGEMR